MDTKSQSLPIAHPNPHSAPRPQGHTCSQCHCSHHCRKCSPVSHPSSSSSPGSTPQARYAKHNMHSRYASPRPSHRGSCSKNRKTLEGKVNKRKAVRKRRRAHRAKRRSSGRRYK